MKKLSFSALIISAMLTLVMISSASAAGTKSFKPKPVATPQFTEIKVNGLRATTADLKQGMTVTVTMGTDATRASRIDAADAPAPGKKK